MAQAYYDEDAGQAQLIREVVETTTESESVVDASKVTYVPELCVLLLLGTTSARTSDPDRRRYT